MKCRKCREDFDIGSEEHIIPKGLGGKTTTRLVFCITCNVELSELDKTLVEQYDIVRNFLGLSGRRGVPKVEFVDSDGNTVRLDSAGHPCRTKPQWKKVLQTSEGERTDALLVPLHCLDQMRHKIERLPGGKEALENIEIVSDLPTVTCRMNLSGHGYPQARAVAKMLYDFALDHMIRRGVLTDFTEVEELIFSGVSRFALCSLEARPEFYRERDDCANVLEVQFDATEHTVIGFATVFGSIMYSALISCRYEGSISYVIRLTNMPTEASVPDVYEELAPPSSSINAARMVDRSYLTAGGPNCDPLLPSVNRLVNKALDARNRRAYNEMLRDCLIESRLDPSAPTEEGAVAFRDCMAREVERRFTAGRPYRIEKPLRTEQGAN